MPRILRLGSLAGLLVAYQAGASLNTDYGIGYTGVYTNNVYRSDTNRQQEGINMLTGVMSLNEHSERTELKLDTEVQGRDYWRHSYGSGMLYGLDGYGRVTLLPRRLTFSVRDVFTQVPVDPLMVLSPSNRQNVNTFSAGPNVFLYFDPIDILELGGRYEKDSYQYAPTSGYRYLGFVHFLHRVSPNVDFSLNYDPSKVYFSDTSLNPDYTRQDAYVGFHLARLETSFRVDVGHTRINQVGQPPISGLLARGVIATKPRQKNSFALSATREYADAGRYALAVTPLTNAPGPLITSPAQLISGGLYLGRYVDGRYTYQREYGTDRVHLFAWRLDYLSSPLSQKLDGGTFNVGYDFSDVWTATVFGGYVHTHYLSFPRTDVDEIGGPGLRYRLTPNIDLDAESIWDRRLSTAQGQGFLEWRAVFSISYNTDQRAAEQNPFLSNANLSYFIYR
ncbi:MAG: hypothetical protein ACYCQK_03310 [Acidiferrobacteraceae bacterium]